MFSSLSKFVVYVCFYIFGFYEDVFLYDVPRLGTASPYSGPARGRFKRSFAVAIKLAAGAAIGR
ncbi:MAG: hypothetical protein FWH26_06145, partial [Oscillospiraceae bacterium]|nr:hypothetical protein [Oscillospiraceae bacterium]